MQEPRFPRIPPEQMDPRQREVAASIAAGPRGEVKGPFLALLHHPDLADRLQQLGEHLRFGTGLPPELVELAVLVTARHWDCQYEWFAHRRIALNTTSLDAAVIDAIAHGQPLPAMPDEQRDACDFCGELLRDGEPGERAYDAILQRYGRRGVLDLLALCGYYGLLAMVLNTARIPLPDGTPAPLPPKHRS
ncbi:carboxymuconolactone decarboxylase family protein [Pigmentiphaga sp.]|uniref:carboxymuconolactone decarboxylase family protein n=1 Tax=Pigmentiphaga sp. TaxID=1977564 RepID=UPI0025DD66FF|nr:carboxymuconolactone decarboxylase family protein [Pigmentiphaga sp.]